MAIKLRDLVKTGVKHTQALPFHGNVDSSNDRDEMMVCKKNVKIYQSAFTNSARGTFNVDQLNAARPSALTSKYALLDFNRALVLTPILYLLSR